ncbi:hypothetical protein [Flavobacterium piscisymbiosum]|uniref:Uncharacterized protein n=1 Tax=Flavobacterium piscisymbiosum TaxID=2893753 RepID=A0ABS8MLG0_9FLAO|nr:hypothetical protein [Flavobacterium sp. F-30]MCC9066334.1 hypothetical protein [Flavobacterium sp. F-30]
MKKFYLITFLFTSLIIHSQDCKYKRNEVDEFTKHKVLETKSEWLAENIAYTLIKINDAKFLSIELGSFKVFAISDGAKLMFLPDKGDPIVLLFPKYEISKTTPGAVASQYVTQSINISDEIYQRFLDEKITKVRFYTTDGYIDKPVKEKRANKFRQQLKCIE